jgi:hypothetical protein
MGTLVSIRLAEPLSSRRAHPGDHFAIELAEDLTVGDVVVAPKGGVGYGEVIDAAPAGMAGRGGKLVLAAREVRVGVLRLPLRGFRLSSSGRNQSSVAAIASATPYVGAVLGFAITGGEIDYPEGVRANAKLAADIFVPILTPPTPAVPGSAAPAAPVGAKPSQKG